MNKNALSKTLLLRGFLFAFRRVTFCYFLFMLEADSLYTRLWGGQHS